MSSWLSCHSDVHAQGAPHTTLWRSASVTHAQQDKKLAFFVEVRIGESSFYSLVLCVAHPLMPPSCLSWGGFFFPFFSGGWEYVWVLASSPPHSAGPARWNAAHPLGVQSHAARVGGCKHGYQGPSRVWKCHAQLDVHHCWTIWWWHGWKQGQGQGQGRWQVDAVTIRCCEMGMGMGTGQMAGWHCRHQILWATIILALTIISAVTFITNRHKSSHIVMGAWIQTPVVSSKDGLCLHVLWYCNDAVVCMYIPN